MAAIASLVVGSALATGTAAEVVSQPVKLTVDGRPVLRATAISRGGVVYVELVGIVRTFSGLVVFAGSKATVSVGNRVASFVVGSSKSNLDGAVVAIGGTTFVADHDTYVPLRFIATRLARATVRINATATIADVTSASAPPGAVATATPAP